MLAFDARAGDRQALNTFVRRTQADVWRLAAHLVDAGAADDLTQETFERAVGALARFEGRSSARTWLLSIARRVCMDELRRRTRRRSAMVRLGASVGVEGELEPDATDGVALAHLVDELEDDRRQAFVLTQLLGLSYEEAAEVCECPIGTIRSRVSRAREDLLGLVLDGETAARPDVGSTDGPDEDLGRTASDRRG